MVVRVEAMREGRISSTVPVNTTSSTTPSTKRQSAKVEELQSYAEESHYLASIHGLIPYDFTILLKGDFETTGNAMKSLRDAIAPLLGGSPLVWFGVRISASSKLGAHLHGVVYLPDGSSAAIRDAIKRRNSKCPRSYQVRPIAAQGLEAWVAYMSGPKNLQRAGARVTRAKAVTLKSLKSRLRMMS